MAHQIVVFSASGDTVVAEWETTDEAKIETARGKFVAAQAEGWGTVTPSADPEEGAIAIDVFDPALEQIVLLKPISGG